MNKEDIVLFADRIGNHEMLSKEFSIELINKISQRKRSTTSSQTVKQINVEDNDLTEIKEIVNSLPISKDREIFLTWPADRLTIQFKFHQFLDNLEDLWYPSRDDVWITDTSSNLLLEIDHEENIRYYEIDRI